jgi:hypothetical protein
MSARTLLLAGVALAVAGMVTALIGIMSPGIFVIGTRLILLGLVACAAAGVYALVRPGAVQDDG